MSSAVLHGGGAGSTVPASTANSTHNSVLAHNSSALRSQSQHHIPTAWRGGLPPRQPVYHHQRKMNSAVQVASSILAAAHAQASVPCRHFPRHCKPVYHTVQLRAHVPAANKGCSNQQWQASRHAQTNACTMVICHHGRDCPGH